MTACSPDIGLALDVRAINGECPTWDERRQALYWIDIEEPALHRLDPATSRDEKWEMPAQIGAFAICRSGAIIAALRTGLVKLDLLERGCLHLASPPYNPLRHRFNDGKCDALGRFWIGAMHDPLASTSPETTTPAQSATPLNVLSQRGGLTQTSANAVIGNGLAWSPDARRIYYSDSPARTVWAFDFDIETASLSSKRIFAQFETSDGMPDGAAIDAEGFYWCALYGGGRIVRLSPEGALDREIRLPVSQPTMCAFGGADYGTLYITSAAHGVSASREPHAGGVFYCRPGVAGCPPALFADE
ncbi:SMP-30/gluconolactonase/LRE family protein [Methylocystis parvus]|uniref:SMP-30/gluconolactonase/LRE family protein n=1 Tax=Methylocystis parvus TaxID=134 RepID=A0A6B8M616_9HYPH|nr:SMP-30/gluconolactonase/LRE family protein [Methylocystis parvus]QGM96773.1 SMP-30/gluconolactonase/LRE family protein [Methylocystis parvus]WBJ99351.1 SMP-30/gluconolactonase/LRE family protein [Methylocystis parvus OBBP]